ncbi:TetR/AcrR family transcriptional regulator [Mesorhizobium sp. M1A.F.Ca.ET.072.01.1.1]|uniref:TetR/AcrR family transcriptional regulator n=1 Tax=Mesorhizobium sp. M1A.F.Ca.ET.072.01.1.1 TaxID=2496753 RepID=UPI000FD5A873|nr:TetR/AcrR family transcriptional regulator [Mesorhizobium sp. M1A.F.Ca.ET.072.01.1.1]RUW48016.1 TetR/AcrR family transcriptional regulator [Mesorhizobium sp. M1A.F.Ca.ET.072.01.1.1]TIV04069.1 MAG: TetR family transcriptional regulator [Mesorhizobium sp.]
MPKIIDVEQTRLRIAKAAGKAIADKGISAVTMIDIANAAGVTTGMITHYFKGKSDIIAAALRVPFMNIEHKIASLLKKGETDLATLLDISIPASRSHFEDGAIWVNFWGVIAADPEFRKLNYSLHREGTKIYDNVVRAAWPESEAWPSDIFDMALRSIVTFLFGLTAGGVTNRAVWTSSTQRTQLQLHLSLVRDWAQRQARAARDNKSSRAAAE